MRMTRLVGQRYKERPAEAMLDSHAFLLRGAYARQVANGIYSLLPPGLRASRKVEQIIREEMDRLGGQEILMPVVMPKELWEQSGRYQSVGRELARFEDRAGHGMVLGMTHEEAAVHLCRDEIDSHAQFPFMVYQIQTKFRDEPRSRGGLIRTREFTMKDAYSFHASQEDLEAFYGRVYRAYQRIFARVGLPEVAAVQSDSGMMGGNVAHEFMLLADAGEDTVVACDSCGYLANMEAATARFGGFPEEPRPLDRVHTPGMKSIEEVCRFLGVEPRQTAKVVFYDADCDGRLVVLLIRGDLEVNEFKLAKIIRTAPVPAGEEKIRAAGSVPGFASPMALDRDQCRIVVDHTIRSSDNLVTGANEEDYHFKNFNLARDLPGVETMDVASVRHGDGCSLCSGRLVLKRGVELGNIFQLGTKYSKAMGMTYLDETGAAQTPLMGCYGIGVGRLVSSIMEARCDAYGPKWPLSTAPWHVHLNALRLGTPTVKEAAEGLYASLLESGVEVLYDDRDERPGVQFADADLLGLPIRVIVSERNLQKGQLEFKRRDSGESGTVQFEDAVGTIRDWITSGLNQLNRAAEDG